MRAALDTNVLVYAEGLDDPRRRGIAAATLEAIGRERLLVPVQVLGELFRVLGRKGGLSRGEARAVIVGWSGSIAVAPTSLAAFDTAVALAESAHLQIWDAVVLAVAAEAGCSLLLSEDMQEGFTWAGVTVVNPFSDPVHPLLLRALRPA